MNHGTRQFNITLGEHAIKKYSCFVVDIKDNICIGTGWHAKMKWAQ